MKKSLVKHSLRWNSKSKNHKILSVKNHKEIFEKCVCPEAFLDFLGVFRKIIEGISGIKITLDSTLEDEYNQYLNQGGANTRSWSESFIRDAVLDYTSKSIFSPEQILCISNDLHRMLGSIKKDI